MAKGLSFADGRAICLLGAMLLSALGCVDHRRVAFSLEQQKVTVDSSSGYAYLIQVHQPVVARGSDSLRPYVAVLGWQQAVSLKAGEKPDSGITTAFVIGGQGHRGDVNLHL